MNVAFVRAYSCERQAKSAITLNAEGRSDKWDLDNHAVLVRTHVKPQECLFTLMKVAGVPKDAKNVKDVKVTSCQVEDCERFVMRDDWKSQRCRIDDCEEHGLVAPCLSCRICAGCASEFVNLTKLYVSSMKLILSDICFILYDLEDQQS